LTVCSVKKLLNASGGAAGGAARGAGGHRAAWLRVNEGPGVSEQLRVFEDYVLREEAARG
jgi:hypothetical protein